jgi:hypothetical protein
VIFMTRLELLLGIKIIFNPSKTGEHIKHYGSLFES